MPAGLPCGELVTAEIGGQNLPPGGSIATRQQDQEASSPALDDDTSLRIFVCYRRSDSRGSAGRLTDRLIAHFGEDHVFFDVDSLAREAGHDYREPINAALTACDVLIAVIGAEWLAPNVNGTRRIDAADDPVRIELDGALTRPDVLVMPVLVDGAAMPRPEDLPEGVRELAFRQAVELRDSSFHRDVSDLIAVLDALKEPPSTVQSPSKWFRFRQTSPLLLGALVGVIAAAVAIPVFALGQGSGGKHQHSSNKPGPQRLHFGDYVLVAGASVNCFVDPTNVPVGSVECYRTSANGVAPRSYSGLIADDGVSVFRYDSHGHYHPVMSKDNATTLKVTPVSPPANPASIPTRGRSLGASQIVQILNTHIQCRAAKATSMIHSVTCFYAGSDGKPASGSYAVSVDKRGVVLSLVSSSGRLRPVFKRSNAQSTSTGGSGGGDRALP